MSGYSLLDANLDPGCCSDRAMDSRIMLYDVYLDGTGEYIGQIRDTSQSLWKEHDARVIHYRGRLTDFIIVATDQLSDRVTKVVTKLAANELG